MIPGKSLSTPHGSIEGFSSLFVTMFRSGWTEALDFVPLHMTKTCFFFLTLLYKLQGFNKAWHLIPAFKGIGKKSGISHTSSIRNPKAVLSVQTLRIAPRIQSPAGVTLGILGSPAGARLELNSSLICTHQWLPSSVGWAAGTSPSWAVLDCILTLLSAQAKAGRPQTRKLL